MVQIEEDVREKVKSLLRELFQFDNQDLDFGIYRIMNFKRKEIEKFIEQDLIAEAERQFQEYSQVGQADLKNEVDRLRAEIVRDFGEGTLDSVGNVKKNEDAPKVKLYLERRKLLEETKIAQSQVSDVFNHIYEFFSRYYDKGDFIPKRRYGGKNKYYIPYNGEEVALYWATKDMYYVKTGEFFKKYSFRAGQYLITFVLAEAKVDAGNAKGEKKYFLLSPDNPVTIDDSAGLVEIRFNYRWLTQEELLKFGKQDIQAAFVKCAIEKIAPLLASSTIAGVLKPRAEGEKSLLEKHLYSYVERNTRDFFIHKNLKEFLENELDFYLKNEVWNLSEFEATDENITRLVVAKAKAIHEISVKIIEFLSQIENFQKKLFEKKKIILRTDYCITLDRVPVEFYDEIGRNVKQVLEWKQLYSLDEVTNGSFYSTINKQTLSPEFLKQYKHLALDTQYFSEEFKFRLLNKIDDIDNLTDGVIIKGDNFQALHLLSSKYSEKIKCVYIDPPYNLGGDDFLYKDEYQHSSWFSLIGNVMNQLRTLLSADGRVFVSIDDNEMSNLRCLMNKLYGEENFVENIIWKKRYGGGAKEKYLVRLHEYVLFYANNKELLDNIFVPLDPATIERYYKFKDEKFAVRGPYRTHPLEATRSVGVRKNLVYPIPGPEGVEIWPVRQWWWDRARVMKALSNNELEFIKSKDGSQTVYTKQYLRDEQGATRRTKPFSIIDDIFTQNGTAEIEDYFGDSRVYLFPKPTKLIRRLVDIADISANSIVLDFFAGSGTTADSIIQINRERKENRKYILIEVGEHFNSVLKKRILKAVFSKNWKKGAPEKMEGLSHILKYHTLESYEDTLNNIEFKQIDGSVQSRLDRLNDYFITYMLDFETRKSPARLGVDIFVKPFDYKIKTINSFGEEIVAVDLVETFNYLLGLTVEKLRRFVDKERIYKVVIGKLENKTVCVVWRELDQIDLEKDKAFIESKILAEKDFDLIYVNGDSHVKNARPIEPEFKRLMGA